MKKTLAIIAGATLSLSAFASQMAPQYLVTHNETAVESNAWVNGHPSPYPTKANSTNRVMWGMVQLACAPVIQNGQCAALIKMDTKSSSPIVLGKVSMQLKSGEITPKSLVANGYRLTVNGPAEVTLTKE